MNNRFHNTTSVEVKLLIAYFTSLIVLGGGGYMLGHALMGDIGAYAGGCLGSAITLFGYLRSAS